MQALTLDEVRALAPDSRAFADARKLAIASKWRRLGREGDALWGVALGSKGDAYAGGATSPGGTGKGPVGQVGAPPAQPAQPASKPPPKHPSRAAPVSLRSGQWNCPWPDTAADLPLDEQTATIRVTVRADGSVEATDIVEDPGDGFAPAAQRCARATRFTPATDVEGRPIRATSPPIRVHFYR